MQVQGDEERHKKSRADSTETNPGVGGDGDRAAPAADESDGQKAKDKVSDDDDSAVDEEDADVD